MYGTQKNSNWLHRLFEQLLTAGIDESERTALPRRAPTLRFEQLEERRLLSATPMSGDFGTLADSLLVGAPGEDHGESLEDAGAIHGFFGVPAMFADFPGITREGITNLLSQSGFEGGESFASKIDGTPQDRDSFGATYTVGDFDGRVFTFSTWSKIAQSTSEIDTPPPTVSITTDDIAIGIPGDEAHAGRVVVGYSIPGEPAIFETFSQSHSTRGDVEGSSEPVDRFSAALTNGDFNNDGIDDLVVGIPFEDIERANGNDAVDAGGVNIIYGRRDVGIDPGTSSGHLESQFLHQNAGGLATNNSDDRFGSALAVGDFNDDGFDDLAVGIPGKDLRVNDSTVLRDGGAVQVFYGSNRGLQTSAGPGNQLFVQGIDTGSSSGELADDFLPGDRFGTSLAAADFNGDGVDDLAVGIPYEDDGDKVDAGAVHLIFGRRNFGLQAGAEGQDDIVLVQGIEGVPEDSEAGDLFGFSLAAGQFNGTFIPGAGDFRDFADDLAIGAPGEDTSQNTLTDSGAVYVYFGREEGFVIPGQTFNQNISGLTFDNGAQPYDYFGAHIWSGNFNGDGVSRGPVHDLAIGVPLDDEGAADAGAVHILYGHNQGLATFGDQHRTQSASGGPSFITGQEVGDNFGGGVAYPYFTIPKLVTPIEGQRFQDWTIQYYLDLDQSSGKVNYRGDREFARNGQIGTDFVLSHFTDMDFGLESPPTEPEAAIDAVNDSTRPQGMAVLAAAPGTVTHARDGYFDREIDRRDTAAPPAANFVTIDHGNGWRTRYFYLKTGSVEVKEGQQVEAGERIALVGGSGEHDGGARLGFNLQYHSDDDYVSVDPFLEPHIYFADPLPYVADLPGVMDTVVTANADPGSIVREFREQGSHNEFVVADGLHDEQINVAFRYSGFRTGDEVLVRWFDPDGDMFDESTVSKASFTADGDWGIASLNLPGDAELGTWTVTILDPDSEREFARDSFEVSCIGVPEIRIETDRLGIDAAYAGHSSVYVAPGRTSPIEIGVTDDKFDNVPRRFTIFNDGSATLDVSGITASEGYVVTNSPLFGLGVVPTSIAPGDSSNFFVSRDFNVASDGIGKVSISSNDGDSLFEFAVGGPAVLPATDAADAQSIRVADPSAGDPQERIEALLNGSPIWEQARSLLTRGLVVDARQSNDEFSIDDSRGTPTHHNQRTNAPFGDVVLVRDSGSTGGPGGGDGSGSPDEDCPPIEDVMSHLNINRANALDALMSRADSLVG